MAGTGLGTPRVTSRIRAALARRPGWLDIVVLVVAAILLGAFAFGLWHLVVGGLIGGNPRAAAFGAGLAVATGIPLLVGIRIVRTRHEGVRSEGR